MKKILILVITIYTIIIYNIDDIEKTSKILNDDEIRLKIISTDNSKSLLINDNNLLLITFIDENEINEILNKLNIRKLYNLITQEIVNIKTYKQNLLRTNLNIENVNIIKQNNIIKIKYNNKQLCIYEKGNNKSLDNCNFIWFIDIDEIDFTDDTEAVFYDNTINQKEVEKFYDKWVDSYKIEDKKIYEIIINEENYDIVDIDITK